MFLSYPLNCFITIQIIIYSKQESTIDLKYTMQGNTLVGFQAIKTSVTACSVFNSSETHKLRLSRSLPITSAMLLKLIKTKLKKVIKLNLF